MEVTMNVSGSLVSDIHVNVQNTSTAFDMSHEFKRHLHKYHRAIPKRAVLCKGVQNLHVFEVFLTSTTIVHARIKRSTGTVLYQASSVVLCSSGSTVSCIL